MLPDLDGSGGSLLNGTESFGCSMEHEYVQRVSTLNGINAASSWVWDMTVLTDFLETHPMIDPKRLAVAGCSLLLQLHIPTANYFFGHTRVSSQLDDRRAEVTGVTNLHASLIRV